MRIVAEQRDQAPRSRSEPAPACSPAAPAPGPQQALALQRAVGNRAASRVLARWSASPDKTKKGVMVPDIVGSELLRFNPPQNQ